MATKMLTSTEDRNSLESEETSCHVSFSYSIKDYGIFKEHYGNNMM